MDLVLTLLIRPRVKNYDDDDDNDDDAGTSCVQTTILTFRTLMCSFVCCYDFRVKQKSVQSQAVQA